VHLKWEFSLSGETFQQVSWLKDGVTVARKDSSGTVTIPPISNFQEHFNISKSDQATFIIYKVTEADEALFTCDVQTNIRNWIDNIQVTVVGKFCFRF